MLNLFKLLWCPEAFIYGKSNVIFEVLLVNSMAHVSYDLSLQSPWGRWQATSPHSELFASGWSFAGTSVSLKCLDPFFLTYRYYYNKR